MTVKECFIQALIQLGTPEETARFRAKQFSSEMPLDSEAVNLELTPEQSRVMIEHMKFMHHLMRNNPEILEAVGKAKEAELARRRKNQ